MTDEEHLAKNLTDMGFPSDAKSWLLDIWNVIQVLDDAYDGDRAGKDDVSRAAMAIFWDLPLNPFYQRFASALQPVLALAVMKWQAANEVEAIGAADERSYMWRAAYYDVVTLAAHLAGVANPLQSLTLYGETYRAYMTEGEGA